MNSSSKPSSSLDVGVEKTTNEHLSRLEPYLIDRLERKRAAVAKKCQQTSHSNGASLNPSRFGVRRLIRSQIHFITYTIIHIIFSLYIRIRQALHAVVDHVVSIFAYHHNTPELIQRDVKGLRKLPYHLSVILKLEGHGRGAGLETLMNEVADIAAWCSSAGVPIVSVYEKTGILKSYLPETHDLVSRKLSLYFGDQGPALSVGAPHLPYVSAPSSASPTSPDSDSGSDTSSATTLPVPHLRIMLLSAEDGRDSIVDLTKTLAEMSQRGKISPNDISLDVVDEELKEGVVGEPDLLVVFGPYPDLNGYPPWQLRLTEIFCVKDNTGVGYQVFLKGLCKYSGAEMRLGR